MVKVVYHEDFNQVYCTDPAAASGRIQTVVNSLKSKVEFVIAKPASREEILSQHTDFHVSQVEREGLYEIAALSAGGAIQAGVIGLLEPCFALIRPPGHHASANSAWGFCYFNNMAIAITYLLRKKLAKRAMVLDIDLHFGDGTVNLLGSCEDVFICNPTADRRANYLNEVEDFLASEKKIDIIGVSAGFDHHVDDWGGLLETADYKRIGVLVKRAARANNGGCFAILEGGYNPSVLGRNVLAFLEGLDD